MDRMFKRRSDAHITEQRPVFTVKGTFCEERHASSSDNWPCDGGTAAESLQKEENPIDLFAKDAQDY